MIIFYWTILSYMQESWFASSDYYTANGLHVQLGLLTLWEKSVQYICCRDWLFRYVTMLNVSQPALWIVMK